MGPSFVSLFYLGEDSTAQGETSGSAKKRVRKCGYCSEKLPTEYIKPFCSRCILKLTGKETSQIKKDFLSVQTEMLTTLKDFQSSFKRRDPEPPIPGPSS